MSLRARLLALILVATLLPAMAVLWILLDTRAQTIARAKEQLTTQVAGIASEIDDRVTGTAQLLFGLGHVPIMGSPNKQGCSQFLADVLKEHPQYTGLITILPNGQSHCDSLNSGRQLHLTDRRYFQRVIQSKRYVVEPVVGRLTGKNVLQIAHPVRDRAGALQFVLLASFNMDDFGRTVAARLPYDHMNFQIWNDDASIVMDYLGRGADALTPDATEKALVLAQGANRFDTQSPAGTQRIWAAAPLPRTPNTGLRLVLSVPQTNLVAREERQFQGALAWLLSYSFLVLVVTVAWSEYALRRPAMRMIDAIARLDQGNFKEPIGTPYPEGELGEMMLAIDRMALSLDQQRAVIQLNTEALEHQANTDALTGLANRNLLTDRLEQALIYAHRANRVTGVMLLDLDRFKTINDSLGHTQGDVLLKTVSQRLLGCVREGDTVARLGGDEFVLVLSDMASVKDLLPVAQDILNALSQPIQLGSQVITAGASLGISAYPNDSNNAEELIRYADTAMYRAKEQGGNTMAFFTPEMNRSVAERLRTEAGLRRALEHGELRLHFQPIVNLATGNITCAEALVRWQNPERGLMPPGQFIGVAEETGLILPIGNWVLQEACRQTMHWQALGLGNIPVAVNLSARQFSSPTLDATIQAALGAAHCPPELLQLEITESMVIANAEEALQTMHRITTMGVKLSIDDFGTGYSSLSYLKRFPVHKLKIDQSFVRDIHVDDDDKAIVDAILTLAHKLGLRTVAEGVETAEQLQYLQAQGCDECQGYLFAQPCTSEEFAKLLQLDQTHGHWQAGE